MATMKKIRRPSVAVVALLVLQLLLSQHISAVDAADFEGFDSDDIEDSDDLIDQHEVTASASAPPPSTSLSADRPLPSTPAAKPSVPSSAADLWDEDEFEGIPIAQSTETLDPAAHVDEQLEPSKPEPSTSPTEPIKFSFRAYAVEIVCVSFLICFIINYFTGKRQNEAIALAWATKFATKDSIFDKNFSLLGTGDGKDTPLLLKEGQDVFKFYASGRRFCQGMLATMELRSRHDLITRLFDLVFSRRDLITFEVVMNEDAMDHVVLAVARKKAAKVMHKEERDLQRYANLGVTPPAGRKWVAEELSVVAESKEVASDMITEAVLDQVLGDKAFQNFGKWFISLHFSDQRPGSRKKILVFQFALPDANNMSDMTRLVSLVPYYIDLIGRYKLSSHTHSKTEAARAKAAQEAYKELQNVRQEALQKRKEQKKKLMEEAEAKLSAEALRKKEEKERARQLKKSAPKIKMLR